MSGNRPVVCFSGFVGAIAIALFIGGCEVRTAGPPGAVVVGPPGIEIVDTSGYHHHGYYDDRHVWHGWYEDEHHVRHDDPGDWHR